MNEKKISLKGVCGLAALISVGLLLRLYHIGFADFWIDEIHTFSRIRYPFEKIVPKLSDSPFPPLYYLTMKVWTLMFDRGPVAMRIPSALFSTLCIPFTYLIGRQMFGRKAAFIAAALITFSPYAIYYAQDAKMYAMLWFFCWAGFYYFYRMTLSKRWQDALMCGVLMSAACYTSYIGFLYVLIFSFLVAALYRNIFYKWMFSLIFIFISYIPWLKISLNAAGKADRSVGWVGNLPDQSVARLLEQTFGRMMSGPLYSSFDLPALLCGFMILLGIIFPVRDSERKALRSGITRQGITLLMISAMSPFLLILINNNILKIYHVETVRYTGFIHLPLTVLAAVGFSKLRNSLASAAVAVLIVILLVSRILPVYNSPTKAAHPYPWRSQLAAVESFAEEGLMICLGTGQHIRYFDKNRIFRTVSARKILNKYPEYTLPDRIIISYHHIKEKERLLSDFLLYLESAGFEQITPQGIDPNKFTIMIRKDHDEADLKKSGLNNALDRI